MSDDALERLLEEWTRVPRYGREAGNAPISRPVAGAFPTREYKHAPPQAISPFDPTYLALLHKHAQKRQRKTQPYKGCSEGAVTKRKVTPYQRQPSVYGNTELSCLYSVVVT
jgi:hypothetical protein